ncbi:DinB family protein [Alteribacillus sp. JSM 102045]|uniref:DinB family protein n=1 Tax=Alteribacillus sp. JSM 102045 TaxID=1562101 RepID=UPI0035C0B9FF
MKSPQEYADSIDEKIASLQQYARKLDEETIRLKPSPKEWSVMELLCHVEEFPLYFTNELEKVVSGEAEEWGRGMDHSGRLKAVEAAESREVDDVLKGIDFTRETVNKLLQRLTENDLKIEKPHRNPKFGTKPMEFLVQHFLEEHLETHQKQFQRIVSQVQHA